MATAKPGLAQPDTVAVFDCDDQRIGAGVMAVMRRGSG
jgi:hypothetical protein